MRRILPATHRVALYTSAALLVACSGDSTSAPIVQTPTTQNPTLTRITLTPPTTSLVAGGNVQFNVTGTLSNGTTQPVSVSYSATGGTISNTGLYVAGSTAGTYRVIATAAGGQADTSSVVITAATTPPPSGGSYVKVVGDDWTTFRSVADLRAAQTFYWVDSQGRDVYNYVTLVPDAVFGQVVRITFPQNSTGPGSSPRIRRTFQPLDKMWYRWRVKFVPGWTTVGVSPSPSDNSYKIAFWTWHNFGGRAGIDYANTSGYLLEWGVRDNAGTQMRYTESVLSGSAPDFGRVNTEWTDNQWYEFVVYYEKTGATSARQYYWRRKLTENNVVVNNSWLFYGLSETGNTTPQAAAIELGINKNRNNTSDMYLMWGPWEVVDGSRYPNPWNMPNLR